MVVLLGPPTASCESFRSPMRSSVICVLLLIITSNASAFSTVARQSVPRCAATAQGLRCARPLLSASAEEVAEGGAQLVWLTGSADLRVHDHGGFTVAASADGDFAVVPLFVLDPSVHLLYPPARLRMLHAALTSVERELKERYDVPLVVRQGKAAEILPRVAQSLSLIHI